MTSLLNFVEASHTAYHAIDQVKSKLKKHQYKELSEQEPFKLKAGGKYFVVRDGGSLIAFIMPKKEIEKATIYLSHSDSPSFRLKPEGEYLQNNMLFWGLEVYGGPIYASWLNRDLAVAGRIIVEANGKEKELLVDLKEHPVMITGLPIHIQRTVNTEGLKLSAQEHLNALVSLFDEKEYKGNYLEKLLKKKYSFQTLLNHELYLTTLDKPVFLGGKKDLVASSKIDNLWSAFASLEALLAVEKTSFSDTLPMIYIANHEEIGSKTYSGADSSFFTSVFKRILYGQNESYEALQQCIAKSKALSLDGAHALDPKSSDQFEPRHTPLLGEGVAIKVDTGASYSYSNQLMASVKRLAKKHQIKIQNYLKKGDKRQGSTLGPMFVEQTSIPALDLGCAQLSMHSIREVASLRDYEFLVKLLTKFYKI